MIRRTPFPVNHEKALHLLWWNAFVLGNFIHFFFEKSKPFLLICLLNFFLVFIDIMNMCSYSEPCKTAFCEWGSEWLQICFIQEASEPSRHCVFLHEYDSRHILRPRSRALRLQNQSQCSSPGSDTSTFHPWSE